MNRNRAPRGIPTGGQFVATPRSEANVSLSPSYRAAVNKARKDHWSLRQDMDHFAENAEAAGSRGDPSFAGALETVADDLQERPSAPIDTSEGTFVTWGQMIPRFLRRK
jgi:hypothetical protein